MQIRTKIQSFRVDMVCDSCNTGRIDATGNTMPEENFPGQVLYEHKCNHCHGLRWYRTTYPYVETEDAGEYRVYKSEEETESPLTEYCKMERQFILNEKFRS